MKTRAEVLQEYRNRVAHPMYQRIVIRNKHQHEKIYYEVSNITTSVEYGIDWLIFDYKHLNDTLRARLKDSHVTEYHEHMESMKE